MKPYIMKISSFIVSLLVANVMLGQSTSGEWKNITISGSPTIILTGNVTISTPVIIPAGASLTIKPGTANRTITATANMDQMFLVENGGTLIIEGTSGRKNSIVIDGGAIFSGNKPFTNKFNKVNNTGIKTRGITNSNGTLTLKNITIQNVYYLNESVKDGKTTYSGTGGAILVNGINAGETRKTFIENCLIQYCVSEEGSALQVTNSNSSDSKGNAEECKVTVKDSEIQYCFAIGDGGGGSGGTIRSNGNTVSHVLLQNVNIHDNYTAGCGGAVYWNGKGTNNTTFYFDGCTVNNNTAKGQGGGMMLETNFDFINNKTIISNNKVINETGTGGGIVVTSYGGNSMAVPSDGNNHYLFTYNLSEYLELDNNEAGEGGGISFNLRNFQLNGTWNGDNSNNQKITITLNLNGATIKNNKANYGDGGGIRFFNDTANGEKYDNGGGAIGNRELNIFVNLDHGTITGNTSVGKGAGIYLKEANITNNKTGHKLSISSNIAGQQGAGIYVDGGKEIRLNIVELSSNKGSDGGAIYLSGQSGTNFTTEGTTTISSNYSDGLGGAIYVNGGSVILNIPTITDNGKDKSGVVKTQKGGAIYVAGAGSGFTAIGNAIIQNNCSITEGGAIYVDGGNVNMADNTISGNNSKDGGAIYANGSVNITGNSTMSGNSATNNGGVIYVNGGDIKTKNNTMLLNISNNHAKNGGAFFVNSGNIDATSCSKATINNNYSSEEGGAFYVKGGKIQMCQTELSGNGINNSTVISTNGGAIALYNGTFEFANNSEIKNNAAIGNGGALFINNTTSTLITCEGGLYTGNKAKNGGGIYAHGPINLIFSADVKANTAENGGGLYLDGGVNMSFGNGLIVLNQAMVENNQTGGVGGGIYLAKGILSFTATQALGIYNNSASFEAADIYASGNYTTVNLPYVKEMDLDGFDVPGSELDWMKDFHELRYENVLKTLNLDIESMIIDFSSAEIIAKNKILTEELCLDLGYDLVFFKLIVKGLDANDNAAITMSYAKDANEIIYRKVLFKCENSGEPMYQYVGLPSGNWKFATTTWSDSKYNEAEFTPGHITEEGEHKGYIFIKRNKINNVEGTREIQVQFLKKAIDNTNVKYKTKEHQDRVINTFRL